MSLNMHERESSLFFGNPTTPTETPHLWGRSLNNYEFFALDFSYGYADATDLASSSLSFSSFLSIQVSIILLL